MVDEGDGAEISVFSVEGVEGVGIGKVGIGDKMQFTNLRSDSLYASHSTVVRV